MIFLSTLAVISIILIGLLIVLIFFTTPKNTLNNSSTNAENEITSDIVSNVTDAIEEIVDNNIEVKEKTFEDEIKQEEPLKEIPKDEKPKNESSKQNKNTKRKIKHFFLKLFSIFFRNKNRNVVDNYSISMEKLNNGDYQVAKNFLTEALKNNSSKIETYLKLANIALQEKNENLAINYYLDLLDTHPEFIDVVLSIGKIYVIRNMNAAAMNILDKLYTKYPNNIEVQMDYLKCKTLVTDYDDPEQTSALIEEYKKLPNHDENPTFNYNVASYYARIGDIDKAYTACKKALKLSPRDFEANKLCGLILIIKHDYEGAKKHLGRALRSNDKNDEVQNLISYIVCQSNSRDELQKQREKYFEFIRKS